VIEPVNSHIESGGLGPARGLGGALKAGLRIAARSHLVKTHSEATPIM
jgi:hypothetical protein